MSEKLQKVMAHAGLGSRRSCEDLIRSGRVSVNGQVAELGDRVDPQDVIAVDGQTIGPPEEYVYYALHKPAGYLSSTRAQGGNPTVMNLVDVEERVYPVGRLDLESEGLILMTNDGALTNQLTHPRYEHEKEYLVKLDREPAEPDLARWRAGITLPDGTAAGTAQVETAAERGPRWIKVIMTEGRKRQIRETARVLGYDVQRLIRVRMASVRLGNLPVGECRSLSGDEVVELRRMVGLKTRPAARPGERSL